MEKRQGLFREGLAKLELEVVLCPCRPRPSPDFDANNPSVNSPRTSKPSPVEAIQKRHSNEAIRENDRSHEGSCGVVHCLFRLLWKGKESFDLTFSLFRSNAKFSVDKQNPISSFIITQCMISSPRIPSFPSFSFQPLRRVSGQPFLTPPSPPPTSTHPSTLPTPY